MFTSQVFELTFLQREKLTENVVSFYFKKPENFHFLAGQYVQVTIPHEADDKGSSRYFTIASAPEEERIMITTRCSGSSFKRKLGALQNGDVVEGFGPLGTFTL